MTGGAGLRRVIHASTAFVALLAAGMGWERVRLLLIGVVVLAGLVETARLTSPGFSNHLHRIVPVFRAGEKRRPSGAFWLAVGFAVASWVPLPGAAAGILCGALADPAAALVGSRWGGGKPKSWVGSLTAFGVAGVLLLTLGLSVIGAMVGGLLAAGLERWSRPLDDNLVIAPGVSLFVWAITSG